MMKQRKGLGCCRAVGLDIYNEPFQMYYIKPNGEFTGVQGVNHQITCVCKGYLLQLKIGGVDGGGLGIRGAEAGVEGAEAGVEGAGSGDEGGGIGGGKLIFYSKFINNGPYRYHFRPLSRIKIQ